MTKPKTKKAGVMDTTATEVRPGVWEFTVGTMEKAYNDKTLIPRYVWQWDSTGRGLNLSLAAGDDPEKAWTDLLYAKTLDHAVMYAWGYDAGAAANRHPCVK